MQGVARGLVERAGVFLSRRFISVLLVVLVLNVVYAVAFTFNPVSIYLSCVGLVLFAVWLVLGDGDSATSAMKAPYTRRRIYGVLLAFIVAGSFALRATGADWGFPILGHPDEYVITDPAVEMVESRNIDPGRNNRPNHISIYASALIYPIVNRVAGGGESVKDGFEADRLPFYLTSRLVTAAWGAAMPAAAFLVGSLVAPAAGLLAAGLFALFPPFVDYSHYVTPDISLTTLIMFAIYFCVRYTRGGRSRHLFLALVAVTLSILEKYPGFLMVPLLMAVVLLRQARIEETAALGAARTTRRVVQIVLGVAGALFLAAAIYGILNPSLTPSFRAFILRSLNRSAPDWWSPRVMPDNFEPRVRMLSRLFAVGGSFLCLSAFLLMFVPDAKIRQLSAVIVGVPVLLFLISPYLFINFSGVLSGISGESRSLHPGHDDLGFLGKLLFYANEYVVSTGYILLPFMLIGLIFVVRKRQNLLPVFFGFFFWICMSALGLYWQRWALPMYTAPLTLTAFGLYRSFRFAAARFGRLKGAIALAAVGVLPAASMFLSAFTMMNQFLLPDTRAVARDWCAERGITPENSEFDGYSPFLPSSAKRIDYTGREDPEYLMVSSSVYYRYFKDRSRFPDLVAMYESIFAMPLVKSFEPLERPATIRWEVRNMKAQGRFLRRARDPDSRAYRGPTITIYRNVTAL